jgi:hypothetical protein
VTDDANNQNDRDLLPNLGGTHYKLRPLSGARPEQLVMLRGYAIQSELVHNDGSIAAIQEKRVLESPAQPGLEDWQLLIEGRAFRTQWVDRGRFSLYGAPKRAPVRDVVEVGTQAPVLRMTGVHWRKRTLTVVEMSDGRRVTFPVHGKGRKVVMVATDESGKWLFKSGYPYQPCTGQSRLGRLFARHYGGSWEAVLAPSEHETVATLILIAITGTQLEAYFYDGGSEGSGKTRYPAKSWQEGPSRARQEQQFRDYVQEVAASESGTADQLTKLAHLKERDVITDAEFEAQVLMVLRARGAGPDIPPWPGTAT